MVQIFPTTSRSLCHYFKHSQFPRLFSSIKVDSGLRNPEISQDLTLSESCVKVRFIRYVSLRNFTLHDDQVIC